jgi:hypothetical protein
MKLVRTFFAVVAIGFASASHAEPTDAGDQVVADTTIARVQKLTTIGGNLQFSGPVSWQGSNVNQTATYSFTRLTNISSLNYSGTIQVRLIVTASPIVPGQPFSYWNLASYTLPEQLLPGYYYENVTQTVPWQFPPDGVYYVHIAAFEYEPGCGGTGNYCVDDYVTFTNRLEVIYPYMTNYVPQVTTTLAVEYYNAAFNHYFVTADPAEIAGLDAGAYNFAFQRTGQQWKVWTAGDGASILDVCRFFTTPGTFGPKSSHFYTALVSECSGLKANPAWIYEKIAGGVKLPVGGVCPAGTQYLYRVYNNGLSGAPNHRYTTSLAIRNQAIALGGVPEDANTACVPL